MDALARTEAAARVSDSSTSRTDRTGIVRIQSLGRMRPQAGRPLRFTGARPRLVQSLETVALSGAELEVRIQLPPADSLSLSGFRVRSKESPGFPPFLRPCGAAASAETR